MAGVKRTSLVGAGHRARPIREIHTASPSIARPNLTRTSAGRCSGLPLQFCREKSVLGPSVRVTHGPFAFSPASSGDRSTTDP